ncbi:wsc domain [Moniliophthora roreri]|nr:wsc domain [Moniliophthora roreri]
MSTVLAGLDPQFVMLAKFLLLRTLRGRGTTKTTAAPPSTTTTVPQSIPDFGNNDYNLLSGRQTYTQGTWASAMKYRKSIDT